MGLLYLDLHSQPCRAVFLFARATGIPFKFQLVDLTKGQQYSDEFGKVSVMRKVPVMKDGSFILTERYEQRIMGKLVRLKTTHVTVSVPAFHPLQVQRKVCKSDHMG
uniref:GST N-terminal domain-containing protein n=1 Tax=Sphaeramia orbicularis TaxID=375764 RepID=A0A672Z2F8_9TELE